MKWTYDDRSFLLDGKRVWIGAGEIHYFRFPRAEWREALLRAKRAGLNTISTYVPWNFHERTEGHYDLEGDRDLGAYLDLIGELGMYAMVRPGPYICSEWDGGGIPSWLCARPVLRFREDDPVYMAAVERWFDRLLPIVSARQITAGGPVVTVQNENEYPGGWDPSMRRYIDKLNGLFRKHGIEAPILACNVHGASQTTVKINDSTEEADQLIRPDMILTYNHHTVVEPVRDLKRKQPGAPLIVSEFWCGAPVYWGQPIREWPTAQAQARAAYEYLSTGAQLVYYMFDGGHNYAFGAGTNIASSYASSYPVGEGGRLTDKYYAVKPANLLAATFGPWLAESEEAPERAGMAADEGARLVVRRDARSGLLAFVSAADGRRDVRLTLPDGRALTVPLGAAGAAAVPVGLDVWSAGTPVTSNLTLLAREDGARVLVLYGPAGAEGFIRVGGEEATLTVGRRQVAERTVGGVRLLVADEEMARRCWLADGRLVFGPDYVAERRADGAHAAMISAATPDAAVLDAGGRLAIRRLRDAAAPRTENVRPPELRAWRKTVCAEAADTASAAESESASAEEGWTPLDGPLSHEALGVPQGYVWYDAELDCEADGVETLLLTHAPNRVSVFVNGVFCGVHAERRSVRMRDDYAHPADWAFEELTIRVRQGRNRLVFLSDDPGHTYDVPTPVGIQGPVYAGSRRATIDRWRDAPPAAVSDDAFRFLYNRHYREPTPLPGVEFDLEVPAGRLAYLILHGVQAWVTVDGEDVLPMSYPESPWTMFPQVKRWLTWRLPDRAAGRTVTVRVQTAGGDPRTLVPEHLVAYTVPVAGECKRWRWKRWAEDGAATAAQRLAGRQDADDCIEVLLPVGGRLSRKGRSLLPAYYEVRFPKPDGRRPVFFHVGEMQKGQLFLNGRNVGRFWRSGGTQERYYLPRSWMEDDNRLVVFEELGLAPQQSVLVYGEPEDWTEVSV